MFFLFCPNTPSGDLVPICYRCDVNTISNLRFWQDMNRPCLRRRCAHTCGDESPGQWQLPVIVTGNLAQLLTVTAGDRQVDPIARRHANMPLGLMQIQKEGGKLLHYCKLFGLLSPSSLRHIYTQQIEEQITPYCNEEPSELDLATFQLVCADLHWNTFDRWASKVTVTLIPSQFRQLFLSNMSNIVAMLVWLLPTVRSAGS